MMGWSPQCYIPSSWKSASRFWRRRFLKSFYHIWAWRPSWSCDQHHVNKFSFTLYLKAFIQNLVQNGTVVSEKICFEFLYVHDLGPRSKNDLGLQYSHSFMKSVSCLYLPTFRSQASIVCEIHCFTFSHTKA